MPKKMYERKVHVMCNSKYAYTEVIDGIIVYHFVCLV